VATGRDAVHREGKEVRRRVVALAHVVACTLSSAGGELAALLPPDIRFDALIIDEARHPGPALSVCLAHNSMPHAVLQS